MNANLATGITHEGCVSGKILNPFVHHLELDTTYEKIKTGILTIILLPVRVTIICCFLISAWLVACAGLWGLTEEDLREKPLTGWRSVLKKLSAQLIRWIFVAGGFRLKVTGIQTHRDAAPVVALAPHSSFMDSLAMVYMGAPSIVAKGETAYIPLFGISLVCFLGKSTYWVGGMHLVVKGQQANRQEAPILVAAPHSTFLDGGIVYATGSPSIIIRKDNDNPYILKLINFTQPVYVWREDSNSRHNTIKEIIDRATSILDWPQILIFPEGTCTNRSCLITFKPGAFYPGVPIQPVCIRYPNKIDTVTWTWDGPGALKLLWLTLTQPYSCCEIEFLPVYHPTEEEKKDPKLFANNVRAVMAKALGVPVLDYTYDDCKLMSRAKEMNLPNATSLVEVQKLRHRLGLANTNIEETLLTSKSVCKDCSKVSYAEFVTLLNIPAQETSSQQLFQIYDKNSVGLIDLREYLLGVLALSKDGTKVDAVKIACKIYDRSGFGRLSEKDFCDVVSHTLAFNEENALEMFHQVDGNQLGYVTFDSFMCYAETSSDLADLLNLTKEEKFAPKHEQFCPSEYYSKKRD